MAAHEPTEDPTPRRLAEARRRGEVPVSRDLVSAAAGAAAVLALAVGGTAATARLIGYWRAAFRAAPTAADTRPALQVGLAQLAHALGAPLGAALGAALVVGLLSTRGLVALGAVEPRLARLSPAEGIRRLVSGAAAFQLGKGVAKAIVVALPAGWLLAPHLGGVLGLAGRPPSVVLAAVGLLARRLAVGAVLAGLALGVLDLLFVQRAHRRRLRMTREEVRREHRETEGDPRHRAERQRLQRELAEQRMVADVRKADFVVVNPEHIAVALRYDRERDAAPVIVASGERLVAERIKQVARQAGVPVFRDVTLARSLRSLPEGEQIPEALYEAVAEIIRVVQAAAPSGPAAPGSSPVAPAASPSVPRGTAWKRA